MGEHRPACQRRVCGDLAAVVSCDCCGELPVAVRFGAVADRIYADPMQIPIRRLDPDLSLPSTAHADDAGYDLVAREGVVLAPGGGRSAVPTGVAVAIPPGYAGFVQPRSGLALRHGVTCLNTPGLIDSGFRDEVRVILVNTDPVDAFEVRRGDRIAQLVVQRVESVEWVPTAILDETSRGTGGFGSTGL